jgi:hypothetical protein
MWLKQNALDRCHIVGVVAVLSMWRSLAVALSRLDAKQAGSAV